MWGGRKEEREMGDRRRDMGDERQDKGYCEGEGLGVRGKKKGKKLCPR